MNSKAIIRAENWLKTMQNGTYCETSDANQVISDLVAIIEQIEKAYRFASNSAAGLTNLCEDSVNSRRCENELEKADSLYRSINN
jgi:hypothetical protein